MKKFVLKLLLRLTAIVAAISFVSPIAYADGEKEIAYEIEYGEERTYLTLLPADPAHTIYYTADGSKPTTESKEYKKRLSAKNQVTVRAAEYNEKGKKVATLKIELNARCAAPTRIAAPDGDGYRVTLSTETEGAAIYYTTDGTKPSTASALYDEPFYVEKDTTLRAVAVKAGYRDSKRIKTVVTKAVGVKSADGEKAADAETDGSAETTYDADALEILERVNARRAEKGIDPLTMDEDLYKAAQIRAKELTVVYSHDRPDGRKCYTVLAEVGFDYRVTAENIGWTERWLSTPEYITSAWIASPTHDKNITFSDCDVTGIYYYKVGDVTYWVQIFGKRM
ncbi:MAG: chitobiase/beta-hexosaminidase C-terminal domain-containing protein [Bacteroides sp.]|nr:chitobiase/beta-hexosaminidase C-terminal domain-containing protein [Eubacterium sp.]MCM1417546.1 chitobiase/beta-hexosaminidase C-terminal domain-containing protein [Roseburia sp.]MCM1463176.1 chitobiase/beta-hexosaminidase C-terminal domain-containing protein [Bacteroides sp.]